MDSDEESIEEEEQSSRGAPDVDLPQVATAQDTALQNQQSQNLRQSQSTKKPQEPSKPKDQPLTKQVSASQPRPSEAASSTTIVKGKNDHHKKGEEASEYDEEDEYYDDEDGHEAAVTQAAAPGKGDPTYKQQPKSNSTPASDKPKRPTSVAK